MAVAFSICACSSTAPYAGGPLPSVPAASSDFRVGPNDVVGGGHKKSLLSIRLGDVALPNGLNLTQVNVGIDAIYVTNGSGSRITVAQYTSPHVINVLQYQNGSTTTIGSGSVPTITYSSMTIVVDTKTSSVVMANGTKTPLAFHNVADKSTAGFGLTTSTSALTSSSTVAITFNHGFTVAQTTQQSFDVDFNAFESLVPSVNSSSAQWAARASLSVAQQGLEGTIRGEILNSAGRAVRNAVVVATGSTGTAVASAFTDSTGTFLLHTIAGGSYKLTVYNSYTTASGWHIAASGNTKTNASFVGAASVRVVPGQTAFVEKISD